MIRILGLDSVVEEVCCSVRLVNASGQPLVNIAIDSHCGVPLVGCISFDSFVTFPIRISDLAMGDYLEFTLTGPGAVDVGRAYLPFFSARGDLRRGKQELYVFDKKPLPGQDARGPEAQVFEDEETNRRNARPLAWLDDMAERALIQNRLTRRKQGTRTNLILAAELPDFSTTVLYEEEETPVLALSYGVPDPTHDMNVPNPVEAKYDILRRFQRRGTTNDPNLRPNTSERLKIARALAHEKPSAEDADLLWKFRHSLVGDAKALIKVLLSVNWQDEFEVTQATELLNKWSAVDVADALKLLSNETELSHPAIRATALSALSRCSDDILQRYLLQLVQALRYDREDSALKKKPLVASARKAGPLCRLLVQRSLGNIELASSFHWFISVELKMGAGEDSVFALARDFLKSSFEQTAPGVQMLQALKDQDEFVRAVMGAVRFANASRDRVNERTRRLALALEQVPVSRAPLPLRPRAHVVALRFREARILNSTTSPAVIDLELDDGQLFRCMFKEGDDLRQDQLVIQLIELMDQMFREVGLDLSMTRYRVLSTGPKEGLVEFVSDAQPLSRVLKEYSSIRVYFSQNCHEHGGEAAVLDRFIKSSAGYAVATYVLGIGDRHLDNIMIRPSGCLLHVDFGFAFGRDPKSLATPVRVSKEMVVAMGGRESEGFRSFRSHCCEAYKVLRTGAPLLLSVLGLMSDALIPDLSVTQAYSQALNGVRDRLQLALVDEQEADQWLLAVIDQSVDALGPVIIDYVHNFAQRVGN